MNNFIQDADDAIGYLVQELKDRKLDSHAHIVIVSLNERGMLTLILLNTMRILGQ